MPYHSYIYPYICKADTFSYWKYGFFLLIPVLIDLWLLRWEIGEKKWKLVISALAVSAMIGFLYADFLVAKLQAILFNESLYLRRRFIITAFFICIFSLQMMFSRVRQSLNLFINRVLIIFSVIILVGNFFKPAFGSDPGKIKTTYHKITLPPNYTEKPLLLIVLDEYTSPDPLFRKYKDSSIYNFARYLSKKGWLINQNMKSREISTVHSISSAFNFNISDNQEFRNCNENLAGHLLQYSLLTDSLKKKGVSIRNFSIFNVGGTSSFFPLYYIPTDFTGLFFSHTIYPRIWTHMHHLDMEDLKNSFYLSSYYNLNVVERLRQTLSVRPGDKQFFYFHLYMPHEPIEFGKEISLKKYDLDNYYQYWNFTNRKMLAILQNAEVLDQFRIIITGDHAYRSSKEIDPYDTFAAFWGFDEASVNKIQSVQDIGKLIFANFTERSDK